MAKRKAAAKKRARGEREHRFREVCDPCGGLTLYDGAFTAENVEAAAAARVAHERARHPPMQVRREGYYAPAGGRSR